MNATTTSSALWPERLDLAPTPEVSDEEFRRLLGYPADRELSERAVELMGEARAWFAAHGRPWTTWRELSVEDRDGELRLDGVSVRSAKLRTRWARLRAERVVAVLGCAGAATEEQARRLWEDGKPDEYFFLETFGSAVVEALITQAAGAVCAQAEAEGWTAVPRYSPGFPGWEISDQVELFAVARGSRVYEWPDPIEVLSSGMLRPKKSQLALIGLRRRTEGDVPEASSNPCGQCSLARCDFRRKPYRPTLLRPAGWSGAGRLHS